MRTRALVLMYHRIGTTRVDPWGLCVAAQHFAEHLEILVEEAHPVPLRALADHTGPRTFPDRSVVVTFDDGYADNFHSAKPLLERFDVPATVFVATGYVGGERRFWWDELERVIFQPKVLPSTLRIRVGEETHDWELGEAGDSMEKTAQQCVTWRAWQPPTTARQSVYLPVWQLLQPLTDSQRSEVLDELAEWSATAPNGPTPRPMFPGEVIALAEDGLIEVGAHTVTHPVLATLPEESQWEEIRGSKSWLEDLLGKPVTSFAYPYGAPSNYRDETVKLVRAAGFDRACSTLPGLVEADSDPYQLPRFQVENWDGSEFARRLSCWFET